MKKKIKINLNENQSNLAFITQSSLSVNTNLASNTISPESDNVISDRILQLIQKIFDTFENQTQVAENLAAINKYLALELPLDDRPHIFKHLNYLLGAFFANRVLDKNLYHLCFEMMSALKIQIDKQEQDNAVLSEIEWEELEKSVYLLSDWKDQIHFEGEPMTLNKDHLN